MGMSDFYGPADRAESVATIHAALDAGVTLLDTGDFYGMGHNELLLREALAGRPRDAVVLSVKFGALRDARGGWNGVDGRPAAVKNFLAYTLQRLGTDHVDVYRLARVDPAVPIEETVGAIAETVKAGLVRHVGLSETGAATIRRAHAVVRSATSRSSTRSPRARSRTRSCPPRASSGSRSPPTVSSPGAS
jgi:aryl-alcohol dehydrogenase-like predicted oxidoreductase